MYRYTNFSGSCTHLTYHIDFIDVVSPNECICPGDKLTYECTVTKGAQTIWNGSAFDCPDRNNQIKFNSKLRYYRNRRCTNATIKGRIISTGGNNYTSQLSITVTPDTARKSIACLSNNERTTRPIFSLVIPTIGLSTYKGLYMHRF